MYRAHQNSNDINNGKGSFLRRNAQRLAAVAAISLAGPVGLASTASAAPPPVPATDHATVVDSAVGPEVSTPMPSASIPDFPLPDLPGMTIPTPDSGGPGDPWAPPFDPQIIPTDPVVPGDKPNDDPEEPEDETTETTVPETTVPETTVPEVEDHSDERSAGKELAYTGNDSRLPLVGAGLVAAGGLAAGLSVLSRRRRLS